MKKIVIFLVIAALLMMAILLGKVVVSKLKSTQTSPTTNQKVGTTTKTGVISSNSGVFYLQEAGQTPKEIDSYTVELGDYVGQSVTVSGQYSGDTLFVGAIEKK